MRKRWLLAGAAWMLAVLSAQTSGWAQGQANDKAGGQAKRRPGVVLYQVRAEVTADEQAALDAVRKQYGLMTAKRLLKGQIQQDKGHAAKLPDEEQICADLLATGAVDFAEPDYLLPLAQDQAPNDPRYPDQWHHPKINSPGAWGVTTGNTSVVVAVCDTGVDAAHPDLASRLLTGFNSADDTANTSDIHGHGTMTAGTVGAVGNNGIGVAGVNWSVSILPIRVTNDTRGYAYLSDMAEGIRWAADHGAKVANLSYSGANSYTIDSAATYLRDRGGLLFMAAGNDGANRASYPDFASFVAVGATDSKDKRASWSNYGTFIDVVAPGVGIWTTARGGGYSNPDGTSFASPCAAGVAALILSVSADFTPAQVEGFIFSTCKDLGDPGEDRVYGHGRIDAAAAVAAAQAAAGNVNQPPVAVASASPNSGTAPLAVFFDGRGSHDSDGTIVAYAWDFGDGGKGTGDTVAHTYADAGAYTARLTVTDNQGASASSTVVVTVSPDPAKVVHVLQIDMSLTSSKSGSQAVARVFVVDRDGIARPGATVTGQWSGLVAGVSSGVTGDDGSISLTSPKSKKSGTFTFTVTDVKLSGYTYDAGQNVETSGSISQ